MENVEPLGFFAAIHGSNDWISEGLNRAIAQAKNNRARVE